MYACASKALWSQLDSASQTSEDPPEAELLEITEDNESGGQEVGPRRMD